MILPFFDHACNTWYPNLNKNLKTRLQDTQNKCNRFCLKLDDRKSITVQEFEKINWLPIHERVNHCIIAYFLVHINFMPKKRQIILMKFSPIQSATEFLHVTPIKN